MVFVRIGCMVPVFNPLQFLLIYHFRIKLTVFINILFFLNFPGVRELCENSLMFLRKLREFFLVILLCLCFFHSTACLHRLVVLLVVM